MTQNRIHLPLALALARGFRFAPDAPVAPRAPEGQTELEAMSEPGPGNAEITPEMLDALVSGNADAPNDEAVTDPEVVTEESSAEAKEDEDADTAPGEAASVEPTDDAEGTPAPTEPEATPAAAGEQPKAPPKETVQAPAPDAEAERLEGEYTALRKELDDLTDKILADDSYDPMGEDAAKKDKLTLKLGKIERELKDREAQATRQQLAAARDERAYVKWSEKEAKANPGRDAAGWRLEWETICAETAKKYPNRTRDQLQALREDKFEEKKRLLNGRAASEALKKKVPPATPKKPAPPVTPNGARMTPRAPTAPTSPAPAAKTARDALFRGDYDQAIMREMQEYGIG